MSSEDDAQAMCKPIAAGDVKVGSHIIIKGHPCKVMDVSKSKTGKHGHAKANITGVCVLTAKKFLDVQPAHAQMYTAEIKKREFQLIGLQDGEATLLNEENDTSTIRCEGEVGEELAKEYDENDADNDMIVTVMTAPMMEVENQPTKHEVICAFKKVKADKK